MRTLRSNTAARLCFLLLLQLGPAACKREAARGAPGDDQTSERRVQLHLSPTPSPSRAAAPSSPAVGEKATSNVESKPELELAGDVLSTPPTPAPAPGTPHGAPSAHCVSGWITPERGTPLRQAALDMMRANPDELFVVSEMRYFVGPEDAEVIGPRGPVERWYIKAHALSNPARRHRWLIRRAPNGSGIDAVAPYDSKGYGPRTWKRVDAKDDKLADPFLLPCDRAAPNEKCMGLPREVLGCLDGT